MSRLKKRYQAEIKAELQEKFGYANPMKIPGLLKIVINMGIAEASKDKNSIQDCVKEMTHAIRSKTDCHKSQKSDFEL